jgi:hypothetical protein
VDSSSKTFLKIFCFLVSVFLTGTFLFNWMMDPFDLHHSIKIAKVNLAKREPEKQHRLCKAVAIASRKPTAILLGSSRMNEGIDPVDVESITGETCYNAGLNGAIFPEIYHYFEHALHHQPHLKVVILGLDLFAFDKNGRFADDFLKERLQANRLAAKDLWASLFSKSALLASYSTLKSNYFEEGISALTDKGFLNPPFAEKQLQEKAAKGNVNFHLLSRSFFETPCLYGKYQLDPEKIALFEKLVRKCQEKSIELKVFFVPAHSYYWACLHHVGLWPVLEDLKRQLTVLYSIWDFSGFNRITTQIKGNMQNSYYDISHFKPHIGKMMVEKMFGLTQEPSDFGFLLTADTIENKLDEMRRQREKFLQTHPFFKEGRDQILAELSRL